jgi:hypothetical protein
MEERLERLEKVKENPNLVRNSFNRAILNTDIEGLKAYKAQKNKEHKVTSEINNMKQDINELKTLMQRILDKIG